MKVFSILGIRPDIIRLSIILDKLDKSGLEHKIVHTGQHYSYNLDKIFFEELGVRLPDFNLKVGSGTHAEQTGMVMNSIEKLLMKEKPDMVIILGDNNSALGSTLAAAKLNLFVVHIEAGMRSFDWRMPEEKNRVVIDHLSRFLFPYTNLYKEHLLSEGIDSFRILVSGNPIVDVVNKYRESAEKTTILNDLNLEKNEYFLVTAHRAENVDDKVQLSKILRGLELVGKKCDKPIIYPLYPRTKKRIEDMGLKIPKEVLITEPLGFLEFLNLEANALCLITDSGTVQEEGCIMKVPCVTIRISTERPETVEVGANIVSGLEPGNILDAVGKMLDRKRNWKNPLGDGKASMRIVNKIKNLNIYEKVEDTIKDKRKRRGFSPYLWGGKK
jgi:UDP-N-acetylglucosamine 2-epimerase (non-hydrolysing)